MVQRNSPSNRQNLPLDFRVRFMFCKSLFFKGLLFIVNVIMIYNIIYQEFFQQLQIAEFTIC